MARRCMCKRVYGKLRCGLFMGLLQTAISSPAPFPDKDSLQEALAEWISNATSAQERFGPISAWDVGAVTDMSELVRDKHSFNEDIDAWDVSKVTSMSLMFLSASTFNHPLNS